MIPLKAQLSQIWLKGGGRLNTWFPNGIARSFE